MLWREEKSKIHEIFQDFGVAAEGIKDNARTKGFFESYSVQSKFSEKAIN
jgi:hypothetical protein